jgi:hypothetical protein
MRRVAITFAALLGVASSAHADFIDFTEMTFGPVRSITINGLTVTTGNGDGTELIASTDGAGLGMLGGGRSAGMDEFDSGWLEFSVAGTAFIQSLSVLPYLLIDGSPSDIPFEFGTRAHSPGIASGISYHLVENGMPATISFDYLPIGGANLVRTWVTSDFGQIPLDLYARDHPGAVFDYGFMVTGIEYTTHPVPEPTTLLLLTLGAGVMGVRRRFGSHH